MVRNSTSIVTKQNKIWALGVLIGTVVLLHAGLLKGQPWEIDVCILIFKCVHTNVCRCTHVHIYTHTCLDIYIKNYKDHSDIPIPIQHGTTCRIFPLFRF